jgi:phosphate transport system substrate-binding protein
MEPRKMALLTLVVTIAGFGVLIGFQAYTLTQVNNIEQPPFTLSSDLLTPGEKNLAISGSTTCYPTITSAADTFMTYNFDYNIRVSGGGSGQGVSDVTSGVVDIGMMSRYPKTSEHAELITTYGAYHDVQFALDGVSIIASKSGSAPTISWITLDELHEIYTGEIDNWQELENCTTNLAIDPHTRESGSGTRGTFEDLVKYNATGQELGDNSSYTSAVGSYTTSDGNPAMAEDVGGTEGAIGYVGLAFVDTANHILLKIKGWNETANDWSEPIEPSEDTIRDGSYAIWRPLHLIVPGVTIPTSIQPFVDFILGETGQDIVEDTGYITLEGAGGDILVTA